MIEYIDEIKALPQYRLWFEPGAMKFFKCRLGNGKVYGGKYFVTSEHNSSSYYNYPRMYTIREIRPDGIDTVGEFQAYDTKREAISDIKKLLKAEDK